MICLVPLVKSKIQDIKDEEQSSIIKIINAILIDPEYLALNDQQQLRILIIVYNMLERHLKEQNLSNKPLANQI
jgi:hypothetical protein